MSNQASKDETNRDKALRGVAVKVSDGRLAEMRTQAIRNEGISIEAVYHWHWAAVANELVENRAENARLHAALTEIADECEWHRWSNVARKALGRPTVAKSPAETEAPQK